MKMYLLNWSFAKGNKNISIINYKPVRKRNLLEYGNDSNINTKRQWGVHTNGAKRGNPKHSCLDWQLDLGHIHINYIDFNYNHKARKKK